MRGPVWRGSGRCVPAGAVCAAAASRRDWVVARTTPAGVSRRTIHTGAMSGKHHDGKGRRRPPAAPAVRFALAVVLGLAGTAPAAAADGATTTATQHDRVILPATRQPAPALAVPAPVPT